MDRFGEKLRALRERKGLSMRKLAAEFDFSSHGTIADLESGRMKPSVALVIKIARYFDVSTDSLLLDELEID